MCLQCTLALAAWLLDASKPLCAVTLRSPCRLSVELRYPDCVGLGNTLKGYRYYAHFGQNALLAVYTLPGGLGLSVVLWVLQY